MESRGPLGFRGEHGLWGSGVDHSCYLLAKNVAASCQYPEHGVRYHCKITDKLLDKEEFQTA